MSCSRRRARSIYPSSGVELTSAWRARPSPPAPNPCLYRSWGMDLIGMTNLQEAKLAREAEICYVTVAMVTDYDCWHEEEEPGYGGNAHRHLEQEQPKREAPDCPGQSPGYPAISIVPATTPSKTPSSPIRIPYPRRCAGVWSPSWESTWADGETGLLMIGG